MAKPSHDIIVIGGGAAGLSVTSGCSQLGMKTLLIDKEQRLGGDCLYYGCVPSKTFIKSASFAHEVQHLEKYGLQSYGPPTINLEKINQRVATVIEGISHHDSPERFYGLGAEIEFGDPKFISDHEIELNGKRFSAKNFVIATGSRPFVPGKMGLEDLGYISNKDAFSQKEVPKSLITLGAGPIGLELSQSFARLGSKVTVLDMADHILPREDVDFAEVLQKKLEAEGLSFHLEVKAKKISKNNGKKQIICEGPQGELVLEADEILVAIGRSPNTEGLGLEKIGVELDRGFIKTDKKLRSSRKHIYAIGDVNGKYLFTHVSGAEASFIVKRLALHLPGSMSYDNVPWVTFTDPEFASIGFNEARAKERGLEYTAILQDFSSNDRSNAEGSEDGKLKILLNKKEQIVGIQILGAKAGELLGIGLYAVMEKWKINKLLNPIYPYPTMNELYKSAAGGLLGPRLFNTKIRKMLRGLFGYRGRRD